MFYLYYYSFIIPSATIHHSPVIITPINDYLSHQLLIIHQSAFIINNINFLNDQRNGVSRKSRHGAFSRSRHGASVFDSILIIIIIIIVSEIYRVLQQRLVQQRLVQQRLAQQRLVKQRFFQQRLPHAAETTTAAATAGLATTTSVSIAAFVS